MNLKHALHWFIYISVHSVLCHCHTQTHTHMHPQTIWGQWTDGAESEHCPVFFKVFFKVCSYLYLSASGSVTVCVLLCVCVPEVSPGVFWWLHGEGSQGLQGLQTLQQRGKQVGLGCRCGLGAEEWGMQVWLRHKGVLGAGVGLDTRETWTQVLA